MPYQTLNIHTQNTLTFITLNRPDKKNAMNFVMMRELLAVATLLAKDKRTQAVIIKGADGNFCSGLDLADLNNPKNLGFALWELAKPSLSIFQKVCLAWRNLPMPVIAVIEGACVGAGLQLALGADIRISQADATLSILEAKWGLVADMGLTQSALGLPSDTLKELAMTARLIDGQSAKDFGLVSHLSDIPLNHALALADEIINRSPDAVLAAKRLINGMYQQSACRLYQEKYWQIKLILGNNRKIALKKAKDESLQFIKRQFG